MGGGICQVSSTIHVAMLLAGITPTQRYAHSLPVDYVPKGLDSAIVEGYKDLTFTNKFDFPNRLSACRICDRILVLDRGRVLQQGPHHILAAQEIKNPSRFV